MTKFVPILAATALLVSVPALAADMQNGSAGSAGTVQTVPPMKAPSADTLPAMSKKELTGAAVYDRAGDKVGEVKKVVKEPTGKTNHAVLSVGGVLGIGGKDVRVPLEAIHLDKEGQLVVAMSEKELEELPAEMTSDN